MDCRIHKLVTDVTVLAQEQVLLVRYRDTRRYDGQTGWFLPDDYLEHVEHPDAAAVRILEEQAGLAASHARLSHIESFDGDGSPWHLVFHYVVKHEEPSAVVPGDNVLAAEWFRLDELPPGAEQAHGGWAAEVLDEIRRRLESEP